MAVIVSIFYYSAQATSDKIIYCISTPRSLSTVFFRMMEHRGDFKALEEIGVDAYTRIYDADGSDIICEGHKPQTFQAAQELLLRSLRSHHHLFLKEIGFAAQHYLFSEELRDIAEEKAITVFLVRDPHAALISLYRKRPELFNALEDWMSYESLWALFEKVKRISKHSPYIIISEDLFADPEKVVKDFCEYCEIPFDPAYLHWPALSETMAVDHPWNSEIGHLWYDKLLESTGFFTPKGYHVDNQGNPTFTEIENPEHRMVYQALYAKCKPYYEKFLVAAHLRKK